MFIKKRIKSLFSMFLTFVMIFSMVHIGMQQVYAEKSEKIKVKLRVEGPEYTILPETEVEVEKGASNSKALKKLGLKVSDQGGMINTINGISGQPFWSINPWEANGLEEGSSIVFNGRAQQGKTIITGPSAVKAGEKFEVVLKSENGTAMNDAEIKYYKADEYDYKGINTKGIKAKSTGENTDKSGKASIQLEAGKYFITAEKEGMSRAKALEVEVKEEEHKCIEKFEVERIGEKLLKRDSSEEVKFSVKNNDKKDRNVTLAVVLYDKNTKQMKNYGYITKTLKSGEKEILAVGFTIPKEGKYEIKAIVCDDLNVEKMNILSKPVVILVK